MKLHTDPDIFRELINHTAEARGIQPRFIEKDYWLTTLLHALSRSPHRHLVVFKGGTSLSKAYNIIQRFSEDADLALIVADLSGNQVKSRMDSISKNMTKHLTEVFIEGVTSKGSRFRRTAHNFPSLLEHLIFPTQAREELILEINAFANPFPFQEMEITSFIGEHLQNLGRDDLNQLYGLLPFSLQVLKPNRTLAEKILALARASYAPDPLKQLQDKIRHTYDLYCLFQLPEMQAFITGADFFPTLRAVQTDDAKNSEFQGEWANKPLASAWIYQDDSALWQKMEAIYLGAFKSLVYGPLPAFGDIRQVFTVISNRLKAFDNEPNLN